MIKIVTILLLGFILCLSSKAQKKNTKRPNVIIVITDDQGTGDIASNVKAQEPNFALNRLMPSNKQVNMKRAHLSIADFNQGKYISLHATEVDLMSIYIPANMI